MRLKFIIVAFVVVLFCGLAYVGHYWLKASSYPKSFNDCIQLQSGFAKTNMNKVGRCYFNSETIKFKKLTFCPKFRGIVERTQCGDFACEETEYYCSLQFAKQPAHGIGKLVISSDPNIKKGLFLEVTEGENIGVHEIRGKRDIFFVAPNTTVAYEAVFSKEPFWVGKYNSNKKLFDRIPVPDLFVVEILGYSIVQGSK